MPSIVLVDEPNPSPVSAPSSRHGVVIPEPIAAEEVARGPEEDRALLGARMRWMPAYGAGDRRPAVPPRLWFQWFGWKAGRDGVDPCAMRMAKHLTYFADERTGRITNIPAVIEVYAAHHIVSTRTAWTDRQRLMATGWLREEVAPTGGRKAVYRLCVDPPSSADLAEMPRALAHEFARLFGLPIAPAEAAPVLEEDQDAAGVDPDGAQSPQEPPEETGRDEELEIDLGPVPGSLAFVHRHLADCEVIRVGSATGRRRYSAGACGRLHTTPLPREIFSPSLRSKPDRARKRRSEGVKITPQERAAAEEFMRRCWRDAWRHQRRGVPLSPAEWRRLVEVVAHALRAADNPVDVREELTHALDTARHLPTLLAYRARRIIRRGHRHNANPTLRPETIAARRRHAEAVTAGRQAVHAAAATLAALRDDLVTKQPATAAAATPAPLVTNWATEPEAAAVPLVDAEAAASRRRYALALQRARRQKISSDEGMGGA